MKNPIYILLILCLFTSRRAMSQWRLGGGLGIAYLNDAGSKTHDIYTGKDIYNFYLPVSLYYKPSLSYFFEVLSSFQLKRNYFLFNPHFFSCEVKTVNTYRVNYWDGFYGYKFSTPFSWPSTTIYYKFGFELPISYGFSLTKPNDVYAIYPFVGVSNNFIWTQGTREKWSDITVNDNGHEFNLSKKDELGGGSVMSYYLTAIFGFRFRIKGAYLGIDYKRQIFQKNQSKYDITYQTVNLSLGYVYTFKTKAERQSKKE